MRYSQLVNRPRESGKIKKLLKTSEEIHVVTYFSCWQFPAVLNVFGAELFNINFAENNYNRYGFVHAQITGEQCVSIYF